MISTLFVLESNTCPRIPAKSTRINTSIDIE
jgi:hypothetical protein